MNKKQAEDKIKSGITWGELEQLVLNMEENGYSKVNPSAPKIYVKKIFLSNCKDHASNKKVEIDGGALHSKSMEFFIARNILMECEEKEKKQIIKHKYNTKKPKCIDDYLASWGLF